MRKLGDFMKTLRENIAEMRAKLAEMKENEPLNVTSNESLNVTINEENIKCSFNAFNKFSKNETSNVHKLSENEMISKQKYAQMLTDLEKWNVFCPKSLCFKYGVRRVYDIYKYTLTAEKIRCKGAYFRKMLEKTA